MGKKTFARSIAAYQVQGDVLICSSNKTISGTATAIVVTYWFGLNNQLSFPKNHLSSVKAKQMNRDVVGITMLQL